VLQQRPPALPQHNNIKEQQIMNNQITTIEPIPGLQFSISYNREVIATAAANAAHTAVITLLSYVEAFCGFGVACGKSARVALNQKVSTIRGQAKVRAVRAHVQVDCSLDTVVKTVKTVANTLTVRAERQVSRVLRGVKANVTAVLQPAVDWSRPIGKFLTSPD